MASESEKNKVIVYVTGFGPFAHIKVNPSTAVAKRVANALGRRDDDVAAVHFTELETSVAAVSAYFDDLKATFEDTLRLHPRQKILLFHVGVHSSEKHGVLRVETVGYNELHAAVPDVCGVSFSHEPIRTEDGSTDAHLVSYFASAHGEGGAESCLMRLTQVVEKRNADVARRERAKVRAPKAADSTHPAPSLSAATADSAAAHAAMVMPEFQPPQWVVSTNAGRYLCNYCLYRSLQLQEKFKQSDGEGEGETRAVPPVCSVFVHVCDPLQGIEKTPEGEETNTERPAVQVSTAGDNPTPQHQQEQQQQTEGAIAKYNPTIAEQTQQTELVAHELVDWVLRG